VLHKLQALFLVIGMGLEPKNSSWYLLLSHRNAATELVCDTADASSARIADAAFSYRSPVIQTLRTHTLLLYACSQCQTHGGSCDATKRPIKETTGDTLKQQPN